MKCRDCHLFNQRRGLNIQYAHIHRYTHMQTQLYAQMYNTHKSMYIHAYMCTYNKLDCISRCKQNKKWAFSGKLLCKLICSVVVNDECLQNTRYITIGESCDMNLCPYCTKTGWLSCKVIWVPEVINSSPAKYHATIGTIYIISMHHTP